MCSTISPGRRRLPGAGEPIDGRIVQAAEIEPLPVGAAVLPDGLRPALEASEGDRGLAEHPPGDAGLDDALAAAHDHDGVGVLPDDLENRDVPVVVPVPDILDVRLLGVTGSGVPLQVDFDLPVRVGADEPLHDGRVDVPGIIAADDEMVPRLGDGLAELRRGDVHLLTRFLRHVTEGPRHENLHASLVASKEFRPTEGESVASIV